MNKGSTYIINCRLGASRLQGLRSCGFGVQSLGPWGFRVLSFSKV